MGCKVRHELIREELNGVEYWSWDHHVNHLVDPSGNTVGKIIGVGGPSIFDRTGRENYSDPGCTNDVDTYILLRAVEIFQWGA